MSLLAIITVGALVQNALINKGYLTRGYLSSGLFFHQDNIVVGPALIDAYEKEREMGDRPFIGVDPQIIHAAKQQKYIAEWNFVFEHMFLYEETYILDYLNVVDDPNPSTIPAYTKSSEQLKSLIEMAKTQIGNLTKDDEATEKIRKKWHVFLDYTKSSLEKRNPKKNVVIAS